MRLRIIFSFLIVMIALFVLNVLPNRITAASRMEENPTSAYSYEIEECWIEVEIIPKNGQQAVNDEILLLLYDNFLSNNRQNITSWHFFREPALRFRIELADRKDRESIAAELKSYLDSVELAEDHYFARHGQRIQSFDEGYTGEYNQYKRMWPYQKKLWEWGAEMTVESIKESKETGASDPPRQYQLERIFHLLSNQLLPGYEVEWAKSFAQYYLYWGLLIGIPIGALLLFAFASLFKHFSKKASKRAS